MPFTDNADAAQNHDYHVFFEKSRISTEYIEFPQGSNRGNAYSFGKSKGSGRVYFKEKTDADFALMVKGQTAVVSIDGEMTELALPAK